MAAAPGNKTRYALLGLLAAGGPYSGYDLKQVMDRSVSYFWNESYGQIYPTLRGLAADGLAEARETPARGKAGRIEYRITEQGRAELEDWLSVQPAEVKHRDEMLLKLFFGRHVDGAQQIVQLRQHQASLRALQVEYDTLHAKLEQECAEVPALPYWLITLHWGQHWVRARLAWAEEALAELHRLNPSLDTPET